MSRNLFFAGAAGVVGRVLSPLLVADGWRVTGTTRSEEKAALLRSMGVEPVIVDVFDAEALAQAVQQARPSVVIHQLTDLPLNLDPSRLAQALANNARIRDIGTRHLVAAAIKSGAERLIAQSIAFAYADGPQPYTEESPLNTQAEGPRAVSVQGVISLERQVLEAPLKGIVLRYGRFYGPGTGADAPTGPGPVHVEAAARAAQLALAHDAPGLYNIAEDDGTVASDKAKRVFGWSADWRRAV